MPRFLNVLYLFILGLLLAGCPEKPSPFLLRDTVPVDQYTFIDSLKEKAIRYYPTDPELSEQFLDMATRACDSINLPQRKFQILLEKAEFYQYRKPNFLKSTRNLSEAVKIFIEYPGPYAEDPYIYINIGNFFYELGHFDKAQLFFRLAIIISQKIEHPHAQAIALQNIGLSYQQMGQLDSAFYYFNDSKTFSYETGYLTRALSFYYLANLYMDLQPRGFTLNQVDSAFLLIDKFQATPPEALGTVYPKLIVASLELESKLYLLLYNYFVELNVLDQSNALLEKSLIIARKIQDNSSIASVYLEKALHSDSSVKPELVEMLADSAFNAAARVYDPFLLKRYSDTLVALFTLRGEKKLQKKYAAISRATGDSIMKMMGSEELLENQILISSAAAEQAIQKLNFEMAQSRTELLFYRVILIIILTGGIAAILIAAAMIRQKRSLRLAQGHLSFRIRQSMDTSQSEISETVSHGNDTKAEILQRLKEINDEQRVFVRKDLSLNELATMLHTNKTYLSEIINRQFGMNFNDYINQLRITEACRIIMDPASDRLSYDQIAEQCGFSSKSTFYAAFKKVTGMSPAAFSRTIS